MRWPLATPTREPTPCFPATPVTGSTKARTASGSWRSPTRTPTSSRTVPGVRFPPVDALQRRSRHARNGADPAGRWFGLPDRRSGLEKPGPGWGQDLQSCTCQPNVPVKDNWSVTIYDTQTRSMLQTDQKFAGINSLGEGLKTMRMAPTT